MPVNGIVTHTTDTQKPVSTEYTASFMAFFKHDRTITAKRQSIRMHFAAAWLIRANSTRVTARMHVYQRATNTSDASFQEPIPLRGPRSCGIRVLRQKTARTRV